MKNPFNPSFGKVPVVFLDRSKLSSRIVNELSDPNSPYQTSLIYGQRGSGKTSLMTDVAYKLNQDKSWIVIDLALNSNLLDNLVSQLQNKLITLDIIKSVDLNFSLGPVSMGVNLEKNQLKFDYQLAIEEALTYFQKRNYKVLITIDEVKRSLQLRNLISYYQIMVRKNLPVALIMAGLPENVSELQNDNVLTFLLRANRIILNPLNNYSVRESYQKVFTHDFMHVDNKAILIMTKWVDGFAYAFQLLGYLVWEEASKTGELTNATVLNAKDDFLLNLNRNVYFKVYSDLTMREKEYVKAMAKMDHNSVKNSELSKALGKPANYLSVYRRKLIDSQIIKSSEYGYVEFALPFFKDFVEEQIFFEEE